MNQIVNPYIAGSPVTGPEMFFGRQDVFDFIGQTLTGKHRDQVIVLYGRRRTGKTSVIYQMRRHLSERYLCIFIDLHGLALDGLDGFLWELANNIRRSLRREYQIELPRLDKSEFMADPRGQFEEHFLNQVWSQTGECHVLLMLDEAVRIQEQVQAGKLEIGIFEYLRHLMQHFERLNFLFSLGSGLEEMEKQYALLFNVALYKKISFLERDAAVALITEPVQEYYEVAPDAVDHILDITSGHPYYTQLICHSVFNRWLGNGARLIGVAEIDDTLEEVVERGLAVLKYVWEESSPAEKAILSGMASAMGDDKQAVTLADITGAWNGLGVTIPRGEAVKAIRSLTARDVIDGDDAYEFRVDLLHMWLLKYERLDWVREEIAVDIAEWQKIAAAEQATLARTNIPRWAAMPLLLTAAIAFCLLGVYFSSTVRNALPFLAFVAPTEMALPAASPAEPSLSDDDANAGGEEGGDLEEYGPLDTTVQTIIDQEGRYFNDFNDYEPGGIELNDGAAIGNVGGEIALILPEQDYSTASLFDLNQDSYEFTYDQFLSVDPGDHNKVAVNLRMPDDSKGYKFLFGDQLEVQFFVDNELVDVEYRHFIRHSLVSGWNGVRVIVDKDLQKVGLYTNGEHIITVDDIGVEDTYTIFFETHTAELSAVDNVLLQPGVTSDISNGAETAVGAEEGVSDGEGVIHFNDFNDYDPGDFDISEGVIGEVNGEVAVIMQGQPDRDMSRLPFSISLGGLDLESYELRGDLYLDFNPSEENGVAINLMMPDDRLRYKFFFRDNLNLQTWINNVVTDQHHEASHNLHNGWNDIRVVVDKDSQTVDLYSNGEHIITVDDIGVEDTYEIFFETHTAELFAVDNVLLRAIASGGVDQGQLLAAPGSGTLQLDGESGYVEVAYAENLNLTDALTIEAWAKANARPSQACTGSDWEYCSMLPIISQSNETSSIGNYYLGIEEGFPVFGFETDDAVDVLYRADSSIGDGWHHLAAVHTFGESAETQLYLDGEPLSGSWVAGQDVSNGPAYPNTGEQYLVGVMTVGGSASYNGLLDELRIWNSTRTESEIKATMMKELTGDEAGLAAYWKFNEPEGGTLARDDSAHGNDGLLRGGAQFQAADAPPLLKPWKNSTWVHPLDGMVMVYVPAGSFVMGSDEGEENEGPQHEVYLDAFWIDQTEVTNAQFAAFVEDTGHVTAAEQDGWAWDSGPDWIEVEGADWRQPRGPDSDINGLGDHPVVHVSWDDAFAYCDWRGDRLPSEAEWEKAARGTDRRRYPWGNEFFAERLNSCDSNCPVPFRNVGDDGYAYTSPVGTYPSGASPYGVLDMAGNVGEWTADWYQDDYYAQSPDTNPEGPASSLRKSERGDSWDTDHEFRGVTVRRGHPANHRASIIGFRCASSSVSSQLAPTGGSGIFIDSGQQLGESDSLIVALGDLDGDGDLDAFVGNSGANFVWFNDGTGQLVDSEQRLGDGFSSAVSLADFDSDGDLDAFVANSDQANLVWLNEGDGTFLDSGQRLGSSSGQAVANGDIDGDGDLDVLVGNDGPAIVWINDGAGSFSKSDQFLGDTPAWAVSLADVDGDKDLDAFFGNTGPNELWLNDGAGAFENSNQSIGDSGSRVVAVADLDGDGDLDVFVANHFDQANLVWLNDGAGLFVDSGQRLGASDSVDMALGDLDGDGDLDAFVANNGHQGNKVWINDGSGVFIDNDQSLGESLSEGMDLGDLDSDGDLDAFVANMESQPDRIWLNQD